MKLLKHIELILKKIINSFLEKDDEPLLIDHINKSIKLNDNCKILLLRQDRIGDVLISVPFVKSLRKKFPNARIDIILSERNVGSKRALIDYVDKIWIYKKNIYALIKLIQDTNKQKYDLLIDLFDNASTTSSLLIKFIKSSYSLGLDKSNRKIYTHVVPLKPKDKFHIVDRVAELMLAFGINPHEIELSLEYHILKEEKLWAENLLGIKSKEIRLGINLSGSSDAKFWGIDNYILFINKVKENYNNIEIILFAENKSADILQKIIIETKTKAAPFASSVHEFAILLSECDIILTPDTSAVHFAAAWNKPCIALYSTGDIKKFGMAWTPYNSPYKSITISEGNLSEIKIEDVFESLSELISEEK